MTGWVAIWAYLVANTTVAYLGAPWALTLLGIEPTANAVVLMGMVLVVVCAAVGAGGVRVLARAVQAGIVDARRVPIGAVALTTVVACLGLLLGLNSAAVGSLIAFGTAAIYLTFFLIALAALT